MEGDEAAAIQSYLQARAALAAAVGAERLAELDAQHSVAPLGQQLRDCIRSLTRDPSQCGLLA